MKKLFLGAALAVSSLTFAQQFGAKAGVTVSSINDKSQLDTKSKVGAYAGLFVNAPIAANFSIQPEVLYSLEGNKYTQNFSALGITQKSAFTNNLHMINIPIMFQYNVTPEFYLEAGPQFGFVVSAQQKTKLEGVLNSNSKAIETKDYYNTFNFSLGAGGAYYFTPNVGINVRYMAGLTDITKDSFKTHSGVFSAGLNFKF